MSAKTRAFLFNFLSFGLIFITLRLLVNFLFPQVVYFYASIISGILGVFLSPRFGAFERNGEDIVLMKWIFLANVKEITLFKN